MSGLKISMVPCATDTKTRDVGVQEVLGAIRNGGVRVKPLVEKIRQSICRELDKHGDYKKAKLAGSKLKKQLPAVLWSGNFSQRANDKLKQHSGLLCADLDSLNSELPRVRGKLERSPHVHCLFLSPSGDGLKVIFHVPADASNHAASFRAVQKHVKEVAGVEIDQACKDPARLCFLSYDPEIYVNENAIELEPLPEPEKPTSAFTPNGAVNLTERQRIAVELLGDIDWQSETSGFVQCPGKPNSNRL